MLKKWNVDEVAEKMPSSLLTEWIAFLNFENEEEEKVRKEAELKREASNMERYMRVKRKK
jgi:hypothetical protein